MVVCVVISKAVITYSENAPNQSSLMIHLFHFTVAPEKLIFTVVGHFVYSCFNDFKYKIVPQKYDNFWNR